MSQTIKAKVKPELLIWARETAGFSLEDAARKLAVRLEKLFAVEQGEDFLTYNQLKNAADVYKRPLAAFFLPKVPEATPVLYDFRLKHGVSHTAYSPRLNFEIRSAISHRDELIELLREVDEPVVDFSHTASMDEHPDSIAERVRSFIGISLQEQKSWKKSSIALKAWKRAFEKLGILVFETSRIPLNEMRGFSLPAAEYPVVVINGADADNARIFTLFHELTHLLLNQGGVCDLSPEDNHNDSDAKIEAFCNAVSASFLVPTNDFSSLIIELDSHELNEEAIKEFAAEYCVSREVIARRLLTLGKISRHNYLRMRESFLAEYEAMRQTQREERGDKSGGPSPATMAVRNLGRTYVRTVLSAYAQDKITLSSVSNYLGVKIRHLEKIGQLVHQG